MVGGARPTLSLVGRKRNIQCFEFIPGWFSLSHFSFCHVPEGAGRKFEGITPQPILVFFVSLSFFQ